VRGSLVVLFFGVGVNLLQVEMMEEGTPGNESVDIETTADEELGLSSYQGYFSRKFSFGFLLFWFVQKKKKGVPSKHAASSVTLRDLMRRSFLDRPSRS
jgi:hypothetical protein